MYILNIPEICKIRRREYETCGHGGYQGLCGNCCQISSRPARIIVVRVDITDLKETCVISYSFF